MFVRYMYIYIFFFSTLLCRDLSFLSINIIHAPCLYSCISNGWIRVTNEYSLSALLPTLNEQNIF